MQAEPLGALTCAPALRLQGVARIELLNEGVAVLPADDAVGGETGCSRMRNRPLRHLDLETCFSLQPSISPVPLCAGCPLHAYRATLGSQTLSTLCLFSSWV